jgi:autotransporter-associated beta strand protein
VDGATAVLAIAGNSDTVGAVSLKNGGSITGTGGTLTGASYAVESGSVSAILGGAVTLTKSTAGTVTLSGANTYTGATTVAAGKLKVNGSTSASSAVGVSSGGTLGGSGTVGGNTTLASGGTLAPGNSPGVLTVAGTTTFSSGSIFEWEIDTSKSNRGTAYDGLNTTAVTGSNAIFKILLTGTQDFTDAFWNQSQEWTDIFKSADGSTTLSN